MLTVLDKTCTPTKGTRFSAGVDLYSRDTTVIHKDEIVTVNLGVKIDFGYMVSDPFRFEHYLQLMIRSSLAKNGLFMPNGVGIIDLDYPDEIKIMLCNVEERPYTINKGDRIAQIILLPHKTLFLGIDSEVERRGGFGSTN